MPDDFKLALAMIVEMGKSAEKGAEGEIFDVVRYAGPQILGSLVREDTPEQERELSANLTRALYSIAHVSAGLTERTSQRSIAAIAFLKIIDEKRPRVLDDLYQIFRKTREKSSTSLLSQYLGQWQKRHFLEADVIAKHAFSTVLLWVLLWTAIEKRKNPPCKWSFDLHKDIALLGAQSRSPPRFRVPIHPFQPTGWLFPDETLEAAEKRLKREFAAHVRDFKEHCQILPVLFQRSVPATKYSGEEPLRWLAARQLHGHSYRRIAKDHLKELPEQDLHTQVERGVKEAARLLKLRIRPVKRASQKK
ncbi:MAG: hypothetical protein GY719_36765 [bacterium]|nr:hypothetical protein [bacterium]